MQLANSLLGVLGHSLVQVSLYIGPHTCGSMLGCRPMIQQRGRHQSSSRKCAVSEVIATISQTDSSFYPQRGFHVYQKWNTCSRRFCRHPQRLSVTQSLWHKASMRHSLELQIRRGLSILSDRKLDVNQTDNYWVLSLRPFFGMAFWLPESGRTFLV